MTTISMQRAGAMPEQHEGYTHGYDSALTRQLIANRTAATHAAFFLPYLQPGMSLLDCGCGSGGITLGLAKIVAPGEVTGVDKAASEIERAQRGALEADVTNLHFVVDNLNQLQLPDSSFDAVFAHTVLEHVAEPGRVLQEMHRVLKPGGLIGIRDVDRGGDLLAPADEALHQLRTLALEVWRRAGGHPNLGRCLRGLLHEAGFASVKASASQEVYSDSATLQFFSQIAVSRCSEADFVEQVVHQHQLATLEQLEVMRTAWLAWPERPDAFLAIPYCEVIAWKSA
jgi:ubiquinone/menaquinone biosynthesis C-methylase UbiE